MTHQQHTTNPAEDFMSLAPGIGIIPPEFRNRGYEKIGVKPGEGGIGNVLAAKAPESTAAADTMRSYLAGVAAGADPQDLAQRMLADTEPTTSRRSRRAAR